MSTDAASALVRRRHELVRHFDKAEADAIWAEEIVFRGREADTAGTGRPAPSP